MKKIDVTKLIRISTYAERAGVSVQAIYKQLKSKSANLELVTIDGMAFVIAKTDLKEKPAKPSYSKNKLKA